MNRREYSRAYNRLKTEKRQQMRGAIERLKRENPERYAELQARAQAELNEPRRTHALHEVSRKITAPTIDIKAFRGNRRDYFIHTKDPWGKEHHYFETLPPDLTETDIEEFLKNRHPSFEGKITRIVPCTCPLCSPQPSGAKLQSSRNC